MHEVVEYSQQCTQGSLSSWAQEERFEIYSQESRTGSLSNWVQEERFDIYSKESNYS